MPLTAAMGGNRERLRIRSVSDSSLHALAVLVSAALICNLFGDVGFIGLAFNSDALLPASFAWDVLHVPDAWRHHQLARAPQLIPDMIGYGSLYMTTASVPLTEVLYAFLQVSGLAYTGGWIAARIAGVSVASGATAVVTLLTLQGLVALEEHAEPFFNIALPMYHIGAFAFALAGV